MEGTRQKKSRGSFCSRHLPHFANLSQPNMPKKQAGYVLSYAKHPLLRCCYTAIN